MQTECEDRNTRLHNVTWDTTECMFTGLAAYHVRAVLSCAQNRMVHAFNSLPDCLNSQRFPRQFWVVALLTNDNALSFFEWNSFSRVSSQRENSLQDDNSSQIMQRKKEVVTTNRMLWEVAHLYSCFVFAWDFPLHVFASKVSRG